VENAANFKHIIRILNTNIDGKRLVPYAIRAIRGIGRRFAITLCKKARIDTTKRAGELSEAEVNKITEVIANPEGHGFPQWFLNRRKDMKDGKYEQVTSNDLDTKLREDIERMKKVRMHRGLRHWWNLKVRGQHTKSTGRHGAAIGYQGKKKSS